jgi:hypothetical protein
MERKIWFKFCKFFFHLIGVKKTNIGLMQRCFEPAAAWYFSSVGHFSPGRAKNDLQRDQNLWFA